MRADTEQRIIREVQILFRDYDLDRGSKNERRMTVLRDACLDMARYNAALENELQSPDCMKFFVRQTALELIPD